MKWGLKMDLPSLASQVNLTCHCGWFTYPVTHPSTDSGALTQCPPSGTAEGRQARSSVLSSCRQRDNSGLAECGASEAYLGIDRATSFWPESNTRAPGGNSVWAGPWTESKSHPVQEQKKTGSRGEMKMPQANGKVLVKTGRTIDQPSREPGAAQCGWNTRYQRWVGKTKLKAKAGSPEPVRHTKAAPWSMRGGWARV